MRTVSFEARAALLLAVPAALIAGSGALAQDAPRPDITVNGTPAPDPATLAAGPEIKGFISAHNGDKLQITAEDGTKSLVAVNETTRIKASSGLFGKTRLGPDQLLNGLPVTIRTLQGPAGLIAGQINLRKGDLKVANMIHHGTDQRFAEQSAATEALRGRVADIDNYNIKSTTNVHFDTGRAALSPGDKDQLCAVATQAEATSNALILVVGYTDSTGSDEVNQALSEKRAGSVINYLQQACHWKPWRMLTPTGMAKADPLASNDTPEGKAQNRRVSVNVLVSKAVDGS